MYSLLFIIGGACYICSFGGQKHVEIKISTPFDSLPFCRTDMELWS